MRLLLYDYILSRKINKRYLLLVTLYPILTNLIDTNKQQINLFIFTLNALTSEPHFGKLSTR